VAATAREVTEEEIARRAYEISESDESTTPEENWWRAERELRELSDAPAAKPRRRAAAATAKTPNEAKPDEAKPDEAKPKRTRSSSSTTAKRRKES
jgi:hypothetical protein